MEDEPINQKVTRGVLDRLGYEPDLVQNGEEALEALKNKDYDLILMDCMMPVMNGYETTKRIREIEGDSRHTIIIALTANAMSDDKEKCLNAGMDDYMTKPINMEENHVIRKLLPPPDRMETHTRDSAPV